MGITTILRELRGVDYTVKVHDHCCTVKFNGITRSIYKVSNDSQYSTWESYKTGKHQPVGDLNYAIYLTIGDILTEVN